MIIEYAIDLILGNHSKSVFEIQCSNYNTIHIYILIPLSIYSYLKSVFLGKKVLKMLPLSKQ